MKVIVAGQSKTGTKSMVVALKELGMNVYDYMEQYTFLHDDWMKIATKGGTAEDFRRMYKNVDAVTDTPVWYYWEELSNAFPEAKIILTVRDSEEACMKSTKKQIESLNTPFMKFLCFFSPSFRNFMHFSKVVGLAPYKQPLSIHRFNELLFRKSYRKHNVYVKKRAPKEKLLVYNVKEGWEPLCKFLGKPVPSIPFPHENKKASITNTAFKTYPLFLRMQGEMILSFTICGVLLLFSCYKVSKLPLFSKALNYCTNLL